MTEFERHKREITLVMAEYEQDVAAAAAWYRGWQARERSKGFRRIGRNDDRTEGQRNGNLS